MTSSTRDRLAGLHTHTDNDRRVFWAGFQMTLQTLGPEGIDSYVESYVRPQNERNFEYDGMSVTRMN